MLLKNATILTLDPPAIQQADLRIENGFVGERARHLAGREGEGVVPLDGKFVVPGLVCAHTHLYSALARGMPPPARAPANFLEILELVWWRLDRALDDESIYASALAGALDAVRAGTTCVYDHHASPSHIRGSLGIIREAIEKVGLRAVLCYEVTDRGGRELRDEGIEENQRMLEWTASHKPALLRAMAGAHASFTLSDDALAACAELARAYGSGLHIHAAEDVCDARDARSNIGVIERLSRLEALNERTMLAHGTHLTGPEISIARKAGAWFAHNPRSNMNNQVGYAPVAAFGDRLLLGTDGIGADMFEEMRFAFFKGRDARIMFAAADWLRVLACNQRRASADFDVDLAGLEPGSAADLVVLDYPNPTPLIAGNLPWHFVFGMSSAHVESVMVAGKFVLLNRRPSVDAEIVAARARKESRKVWARMQNL